MKAQVAIQIHDAGPVWTAYNASASSSPLMERKLGLQWQVYAMTAILLRSLEQLVDLMHPMLFANMLHRSACGNRFSILNSHASFGHGWAIVISEAKR